MEWEHYINVSNELNYQQKLDDIINSQNAF